MKNPLIIKEGFCTRLHATIKEESGTNDYTYKVLLSERTGDAHNKIIAVCGKHLLEKTTNNRYSVWYMTTDDAELSDSYKTLQEAITALGEDEFQDGEIPAHLLSKFKEYV